MLTLFIMSLLTAVGVWLAERRFHCNRWLLGCWFGFLAVIANSFSVLSVAEYNIALSMRDAPVVAAALFFGPVSGVVAGAIAAVERAITPLFGVGAPTWCPLATFFVALVAVAFRRWFLDGQRPTLVQALALGFIFEGLHLSFDLLMGLNRLGRCCEIIFTAFLPESLGLVIALALSAVFLRSTGSFKRNFCTNSTRILLSFMILALIVIKFSYHNAVSATSEQSAGSMRQLEHVFDSQIDFMLHQDAVWIAEKIGTLKPVTSEEIRGIIDETRYDELCLVDPHGKIVGANDEKLKVFDFSKNEKTKKYLNLVEEKGAYIGEPFRPSGLDGVIVKYGGVALPDNSGFIQLGYYRTRLEKEFNQYFFPVFSDDGIGMNDFRFIVSTNDWKVAVTDNSRRETIGHPISELGLARNCEYARVLGDWCYVCVMDIGEWRIFNMLPLSKTFGPAAVQCAVILLLIFAFMFFIRMIMLRFRKQQDHIDRLRAEADERLHEEMLMARKIQVSHLPETLPNSDTYAVSARMVPAKEVGGDFYDSYRLDDGRAVIVIADVSGKGVPAAMFMIGAKFALQTTMSRTTVLAEAVARANGLLCRQNYADMFVTAWIGIYDPETGIVEFVNAGHNPPLVKRADGSVEWIRDRGGIALAAMPGVKYRSHVCKLGEGDSLLLYTDGITEATNIANALYGENRLKKFLSAASNEAVEELFADVSVFADGAEQSDDITVLMLSHKEKP